MKYILICIKYHCIKLSGAEVEIFLETYANTIDADVSHGYQLYW